MQITQATFDFREEQARRVFPKKKEIIQSFLDVIPRTRRGRRISFTTPVDVSSDTRPCIQGAASRIRMGNAPESRKRPLSPGTCRFYRKGNPFVSLACQTIRLTYYLLDRLSTKFLPPPPTPPFRPSPLAVYRPGLRSLGLSAIIFPRSFCELVRSKSCISWQPI